jgi:protein-S-isoprenylcysteine O-methyltransferase Ste14
MQLKSLFLGLVYVVGLYGLLPGLFIGLNSLLGWPVIQFGFLKLVGWGLIGLGLAFFLYLFFMFRFVGKGTPVPSEPPTQLMIKGPYKYTRNPMYLNHLLIFFGWFLVAGYISLLIYLVLVWLGLNLLVTKWEEPQLKKRFGLEYLEYLQTVPRWI